MSPASVPGITPTTVVSVIGGAGAVWAAAVSYRSLRTGAGRSHADLVRPFLAVSAVLAACVLAHPLVAQVLSANVISIVPLMTFLLVFLPWNAFAFRYAGRGRLLTRRRTVPFAALIVVLAAVYVAVAAGVLRPGQEYYSTVLLGASTLLLGLLALTFVSAGLVLLAAYRHESVSLANGIVIVFPVAVLVAAIQVVSLSAFLTRDLLAALFFLAATGTLPVAVARYDVITTRPGTTTLGERTLVEDFNEPVMVVDTDGEIVRSNEQAGRLFGEDADGRRLESVVGADVAGLRETDTVERWTRVGYRRFDPRVSRVTGPGDRTLGRTVTLIDVTERDILQQRIQVLNRILRHNIRNDIDVITAYTESAIHDDGDTEAALRQVLEVSDGIERLSARARRIEKLTRRRDRSESAEPVDLAELVGSVVETVAADESGVSVSVDVPDLTLSLDRALLGFGLRNVVENAIEHNDGPEPRVAIRGRERDSGVCLVVADDGPGIPDAEWQAIETGHEDATGHATGLGLWGTKWAIQTLGGELSRENSDLGGTAVVIELPLPTAPST